MNVNYETEYCTICDQSFHLYDEYIEGSYLCYPCYKNENMKTVLVLAIGCDLNPWDKMYDTSLNTWDSMEVEGVDTIFYFGETKRTGDKIISFPIPESYSTMGEKLLQAFGWCLKNKSFDYIARVNGSCYVDKKELIKHIQTLSDHNVFSGLEVAASENNPRWMWGGGQFILSKDVVQKIVNNYGHWNHGVMEDVALSRLVNELGIPYTKGKACSIDKTNEGWRLMGYGSETYEFKDFSELKKDGQFFYRVKQDHDRTQDEYIMNELFKVL